MRLINIRVNNLLVSKDRDEAYKWLEHAIKNHYEFRIEWVDVKDDK